MDQGGTTSSCWAGFGLQCGPLHKLTRLLAPQRLRIRTILEQQFVILAPDSTPWAEHDFDTVWEDIRTNAQLPFGTCQSWCTEV